MQIIKELNQAEKLALIEQHKGHHLFETHIKSVLENIHCFRVAIFSSDYGKILIHSCLPNIGEDFPYQSLAIAIAYIKANQDFLKTSTQGCLDGQTVQAYKARLKTSQLKLQDCFLDMGNCFVLDKAKNSNKMRNEVTDGMHRLVAYGLATEMNEKCFPIPVYLGTAKSTFSTEI